MERTIEVTGKGSLTLQPDAVQIDFKIVEYAESFAETQNQLNLRVQQFRRAVESAGFRKKDLKSDAYNIDSEYRYLEDETKLIGFKGKHNLTIRFEFEEARLLHLLSTLHPLLDDVPYRVNFGLLDESKHQNTLIDMAVKRAKSEASQLATSAGIKLGPVLKMNFHQSQYLIDSYYESSVRNVKIEAEPDEYIDPEFEPGACSLSRSVNIIWSIDD